MSSERLIGIDFGTSTSVIRTKEYDEDERPVGQELFALPVVFNNGASMVPTIVRSRNDSYSFGYDAEIPTRNSEVFRSFKIDLQSADPTKKETAEFLTKKYFEYLYGEFEHQLVTGFLGDPNAKNVTLVSYPVKWESSIRDFMIETAKEAGFKNVEGMDEAEAAIRAISVQCRDILEKEGLLYNGETSNVMLIDMGAGTTDIVICKYTPGTKISNEILTTWPKGGDVFFGGQEMDQVLKEYVVSKFPEEFRENIRKKITIDKIKAWKENTVSPALKNNSAVTECGDADNIAAYLDIELEEFSLDRSELERLFHDYISQFVQLIAGAIMDSGITPDDIDLIVLTGGHSKWYFVEDILSGKMLDFGDLNLKKIFNNPKRILSVALPQETVALGLVYSKISGTIIVDKGEQLWRKYLETTSLTALEEAAELDHPAALNELAFRYGIGDGFPKNTDKAIELYKKAIKLGHAMANYNLGCCYFEKKQYGDAFNRFNHAAQQSVPEAYNNLGVCYRYGLGVEKDKKTALDCCGKAYDLGYIPAKKSIDELRPSTHPDDHNDPIDTDNIIDYARKINNISQVNFYVYPNLPQMKVSNFLSSYQISSIGTQTFICFFDDTFFGNGKSGFLLSDRCLYWKSFLSQAMCTDLKNIHSFYLANSNISVQMKNGINYILPCAAQVEVKQQFVAFLMKILDFVRSHKE